MRQLLLIGAGGFARETAEAVHAINRARPTWELLGFLDDSPELQGADVDGVPVLGPIDAVHQHGDAAIVVCTGRPSNYVSRRRIVERLALPDERHATIVHPAATVGRSCAIGVGTVLLANADLTAGVAVGRHVAVMPQVVLTHDTRVDDYVTLGSGVRLGGGCHIGRNAYVGSGALVREGLTVGERAMIGMGALVTGDVPAERLWYGAPARDMGRAPLPPSAA